MLVVGLLLLTGMGVRADDVVYSAVTDIGNASQPLIGAVTAAELTSSNHDARVFGSEMFRSLAYTAAATELLKFATQQPRPNNRDAKDGFPSGHTSVAFAFAETLSAHDSHWTIPAYALAAVVGYSRIQGRDHYPLQVLAGAALGYFMAKEVGRNKHWEF
jgi:membrane-associated phospholipid phosphatase